MCMNVVVDVLTAVRESGKTVRQVAEDANTTYETLRGYLYRGKLPSIPATYYLIVATGREVRVPGPFGTVVMRLEKDRTPPPAAPAAVIPLRRKEAA